MLIQGKARTQEAISELEALQQPSRKRGIYETEYGNAAYVSGPRAKTAWDLDMGERIPIHVVTGKFIREAED